MSHLDRMQTTYVVFDNCRSFFVDKFKPSLCSLEWYCLVSSKVLNLKHERNESSCRLFCFCFIDEFNIHLVESEQR